MFGPWGSTVWLPGTAGRNPAGSSRSVGKILEPQSSGCAPSLMYTPVPGHTRVFADPVCKGSRSHWVSSILRYTQVPGVARLRAHACAGSASFIDADSRGGCPAEAADGALGLHLEDRCGQPLLQLGWAGLGRKEGPRISPGGPARGREGGPNRGRIYRHRSGSGHGTIFGVNGSTSEWSWPSD